MVLLLLLFHPTCPPNVRDKKSWSPRAIVVQLTLDQVKRLSDMDVENFYKKFHLRNIRWHQDDLNLDNTVDKLDEKIFVPG